MPFYSLPLISIVEMKLSGNFSKIETSPNVLRDIQPHSDKSVKEEIMVLYTYLTFRLSINLIYKRSPFTVIIDVLLYKNTSVFF